MATGANTKSTLNGLFKEIYANKIENLIPDGVKLLKMIPFLSGEKELGNKYHQPVQLSHEHGVTYADADSGAFTLNDPVAAVYKDASVEGAQLLMRTSMSYQAAFKASNNKKAFVRATALIVQNMVNSLSKRLEVALLYGQSATGIGQPDSISGSSNTRNLIFSSSEWAAGIWAGSETMKIDFVSVSSGALVSTSVSGTVNSADLANKKVNVTAAGIMSTVANLILSTGSSGVYLVYKGALGSEFAGLDKIITNTSSLFGINAGTYNLWKGNTSTLTSGSELSLARIVEAVALAVERGLDEDVVCMISPKVWSDLAADEAGLREYDSSYKPAEAVRGNQKLTYYGPVKIEIHASIYVKEGEAFIFPPKRAKRIGATDITFRLPGRTQQEDFFTELASAAGYELRSYTDQALFIDTPARCVKITNISV